MRHTFRIILRVTVAFAAPLLLACSGDQPTAPPSSVAPVDTSPVIVTPPPPPAPVAAYDVEVRFIGEGGSGAQRDAFARAVARWRDIITGDIGSTTLKVPTGECQDWIPALDETVDDLLIFVRITSIDGEGKVVGRASPCYVNSENALPIMGFFELDSADVRLMEERRILDDVVLHEVGHILGIGTLWNHKRSLLTGAGSDDPYFTGTAARDAFQALGGLTYQGTPVPVENTGATGTRDAHWRRTVFSSELMQGFVQPGGMALSRVTAASLADLGYTVSFTKADNFSFFPNLRMESAAPAVHLGDDIARAPLYEVQRNGSRRLVRPEIE